MGNLNAIIIFLIYQGKMDCSFNVHHALGLHLNFIYPKIYFILFFTFKLTLSANLTCTNFLGRDHIMHSFDIFHTI